MRLLIISLLFISAMSAIGQDAHFSMFYHNSLYLAPSFAGSTGKNRLAANYRNQWPEANKGYVTYSLAYDHHFEKLNSGVGVLLFNDVAGTGNLRTTNIGLLYSYDFNINHLVHIRPGMNLSYTQRGVDFNLLTWGDQMSAAGNAPSSAEPNTYSSVGDVDFAASMLTYGERFWAGLSVDHLLRPNQSLYYNQYEEGNLAKIPIKYQLFGGTKHIIGQRLLRPTPTIMQLAFLYKKQADFSQLDLGFYYHYNPLVLGLWYRGIPFVSHNTKNDAVILVVGIKTEKVNIGYSYDFTVSKLITNSGGSHELAVSYIFSRPTKKRRVHKMVPCPDF